MSKKKFRDVSYVLQKLRKFLLGREHTLHGRFPPLVAPRTTPPAEIPRGPDTKYSENYYYKRNAFHSVQPPVIAPIAEGPPILNDPVKKIETKVIRPDAICFNFAPTPGPAWWWDGHCYYESVPDPPNPSSAPQENDPYCPNPDQKQ
ncbi:NADH dehydrogenase [ubiquinone] 1 alpha subcomplex subunit 7-like [Melitaea cinxia]|uniref:NADH dehydrogenase [ubiquinone] 1 alpha subcomplex subunit 7-like n=1 Tax=Melitaea cinxia TaxID=113334 RepID=UPI001E26F72C|nr:NADH dehydrogenase [ubiquinone] 1 alpha subcomplex subunit 7-like [Melitaea cinxia]